MELKDYLQKLVTIISPINVELNLKNEEVKQVVKALQNKVEEQSKVTNECVESLASKVSGAIINQECLLKDVNANIELVKESTSNGIKAVENLNNSLETLDTKVDTLTEIKGELVSEFSTIVKVQEESVKELETKIVLNNDAVVENSQFVKELGANIESLDNKIDSLCNAQGSITEQVSDVVAHQENLIRELETKVLLVADSTVENIKVVDEMNASVVNLDRKIGTLSDVCSSVTTQINDVCDKQANMVEDFESRVAIVTNSIVEKAQEEIDEKLNLITNTCGLINSQMEEVSLSREDLAKNIESKIVLATDSLVENNKIISSFDATLNKIDEKLETGDVQRKSAKEDILSKINEVMTTLGEKLAQSFTQRKETKEEILEAVKVVNDDINKQITQASTKVDTVVEEITQLLGTSFADISEKLSQENSKNDEFKENLKIDLEKTISEIINKLLKADEENVSTREQLVQTLELAIKTINEQNKEQFNGLDNKLVRLQNEVVKNILEEIKIEDLKVDISEDIALYSVSLKEKIEEIVSFMTSNKENLEKFSNDNIDRTTNLLSKLVEIKEEIDELKLSTASSLVVSEVRRVGEKIEGWSNDILDSISDEMKDACADNVKVISEAVQDSLSFVKDDIQELVIRLTNVNNLAEDVKTVVGASFETYLDDCFIKLDDIKEEVKSYIDLNTQKITCAIQEYQKELQNLSDVDLNLYKEETKQFVQEQISELKETLEELKIKVDVQDLDSLTDVDEVEAVNASINSATESINKRLELLRDIILSEIPSSEMISDGFDGVQEAISELNDKTEKLVNLQTTLDEINVKTDNFANVVKTENASLKDIIERYQDGINAISNMEIVVPESSDTKEFIKDELNKLKEQFIRNLTSVFENISFIEESEEIQNAIWDNADVIRKEITQLKQELVTNNTPSSSVSDIDKKFDKLKSILEGITTGDVAGSDKYIYTLPDVEMDIAKMRMAISEVSDLIKQNREDGFDVADRLNTIDDIRDDISSISKRTNKLILTSDDSNKFLKENIDDFKKILTAITKKCNKIDSTQLNQHIVDVKSLVMSSLKSDKILNEAFMHLAQWIDDTAKTMNAISSQVEVNKYTLSAIKTDFEKMESKIDAKSDEIALVKESISELANKLDKKSDIDYSKSLYEIEYGLDRISEKMDVQELKIKALEKKIEALSTTQGTSDETNSLLEFIASQVTAANENSRSNRLLLQKVTMLEKQMGRFESSIAKITQFVDDAN